MKKYSGLKVFTLIVLVKIVFCGHTPHVPAEHRVQYYLLHPSGGYKYGYDTGSNYFAKQHGDRNNQVEGEYTYKDVSGRNIGLKYTAGVQGFVPVGFDYANLYHKYQPGHYENLHLHSTPYAPQHGYQGPYPDRSYSFSYHAGDHARQESADSVGNVRGSFWYINKDDSHAGYQPTGSTLVHHKAQGYPHIDQHIFRYYQPMTHISYAPQYSNNHIQEGPNPDGSYRFSYSTSDQARQENSDSTGNVRGSYWYINKDGKYDLSYIAGVATGFQPTGGNLATPAHLVAKHLGVDKVPHQEPHHSHEDGSENDLTTTEYPQEDEASSGDASYSFKIDTGDYQREESSDPEGNVQGHYSYTNKDGQFDLSYKAGAQTGFIATGGNLASAETVPTIHPLIHSGGHASPNANIQNLGDASYSFSFETDNHQRQEFSDAAGHINGRYSYQDDAGSHDLSYQAGPEKGFVPTGGTLSVPNGLANADLKAVELSAGPRPKFVSVDSSLSLSQTMPREHSIVNGVLLKSLVPLVSDKNKYGYIFESTH